MLRLGLIIFTVFLAASAVAGQKKAENFVKTVDKTFGKSGPRMVFADVSRSSRPKWRRFPSTASLERFRRRTETYTIAYVWRNGREFTRVSFTSFSESGDWADFLTLYFDAAGVIVKSEHEYRTFYGDFAMVEQIWFSKGVRIASSKVFRDLDGKPTRPNHSDLLDNASMMRSVSVYDRIDRLPFYRIMRK